jgi:glyoxylate/hydroxypyruvate reductase
MRILIYMPSGDVDPWLSGLRQLLPQADARAWHPGDQDAADYALVWRPPAVVLQRRTGLKAIFNLGAGVDALLAQADVLPPNVPLIKLDDAGMADQMAHYVSHAVLRHFRRMDEYAGLQRRASWQELSPRNQAEYNIGVMGLGALGRRVATALADMGFAVRGWSRTAKELKGVSGYVGNAGFAPFLNRLQVIINLLPLTRDTEDILDRHLFAQLAKGAQVINVARGAHLVENDLLAALASGQVACATLDVFRQEPLPEAHPFWREPRIDITPHISAVTEREQSLRQIVEKIGALERGEAVTGLIDRGRGY